MCLFNEFLRYSQNFRGSKRIKLPATIDDFNPYNVDDGMDEVDVIMNQLEAEIPDEAYEYEEFDIDEMLKSNRTIRDRIREISVIVTAAITKAAILKKTVVTHRDMPSNPDVRQKLADIKKYQNDIMKCRKYIEQLRARIDSVQDAGRMEDSENLIAKLDKEARKLKKHRVKLNEKLNNQILTIKKLYADPDYKDKVTGLSDEIKKHKDTYDKMKDERIVMKDKQRRIINEMADLDLEIRTLKEKKITIQNNVKPTAMIDAMTAVDEYEDIKRKNENYDRICTNKQIKMIDRILAKESKIYFNL